MSDAEAAKSAAAVAVVATDLSRDHKPDLPGERERVEAMGGEVMTGGGGGEGAGAMRVWNKGQVGLAMSRSIGDGTVKDVGVIADPEVNHFDLSFTNGEGDVFVLIASDGVWEFISSQEAADVACQHPTDANKGCEELVLLAAERWREKEALHRDDITAILAFLPFLEEDSSVRLSEADGGTSMLTPVQEASGRALLSPLSGKSAASDSPDTFYVGHNIGELGIARLPSDLNGRTPAAQGMHQPTPQPAAPALASTPTTAPTIASTVASTTALTTAAAPADHAAPAPAAPALAQLKSEAPSESSLEPPDEIDDESSEEDDDFSQRRLSVFNPYKEVVGGRKRATSLASALGATEL